MDTLTDQQKQSALLRVLKATTSLPAQVTFYASALGALLLIPQSSLPATLAALAGGVGVNALSSILERVARGESIPDRDILSKVLVAIEESRIAERMTDRETQAMIARLFRRIDLLDFAIQQHEYKLLQVLTEQAMQHEALVSELRGDIRMLATRQQSEQILQLLQELEQHIDQLNLPHITGRKIAARPIPLQRPPRIQHFTGRETELERLLVNLEAGRIVTLYGPGGIGKTALATQAIWSLAPGDEPPARFPDGIFFHSFYNQPQVEFALEAIALAFGEEPRPTPKDAALRALAGRRALIILDGAENADDLPAIIAICGSCGVLITSRTRKDIIESGQAIPSLPILQAAQLLQIIGGPRANDEVATRRICELVGGLPLAVRIVGRYLVEQEVDGADYLAWLEETPLDALNHGQRQHESLPVLLDASVTKLSPNSRLVLGVIGLFALAPFPREFVAEAQALSSSEAGRTLGELVSYGLLSREKDYYQVSHPLVHTYAHQMPVLEVAFERLGDYFVRFARTRAGLTMTNIQDLEVARPHIIAVYTNLFEREMWVPVIEIGHILTRSRGEGYFQRRGYWQAEHTFLANAISACTHLIKTVPANLDQWTHHLADLNYGLGDLYFSKDQYDEAITAFSESLRYYEQLKGHELEIARTKVKLGEIRLNRGEFDLAVACFDDGLRKFGLIEAGGMEFASTHLWLGRSYHHKENYIQARAHYEKSMAFYQSEGESVESAFLLIQLGALEFDEGELAKGKNCFSRAEELLKSATGDLQRIARVRVELANQYRWKKIFGKAVELHQQSIRDFESLGDEPNAAWSMQALGDTFFEQGDRSIAEKVYHEAMQRFDELGIAHGKAYACDHLGMICLEQGRIDDAKAFFEQALEIFQASLLKSGIAYVFFNLGDTERAAGRFEEARRNYQASLEIWKALANTERINLTKNRLKTLSDEVARTRGGHDNNKS